ncbi:MAG: M3 family oligoendopeptidase [Verrucomicrobiota bacterium]
MDWDLTTYFDRFDGPGYRVFRETLERDLKALRAELDAAGAIGGGTLANWARLIGDYENAYQRASHLRSYVGCLASADAANEAYAAEEAALSELSAELSKAAQALEQALGNASEEDFAALCAEGELEDATFTLEEMRRDARLRMSPAEEALAQDLAVNGIKAWSRLYFTLAGTLKFSYTTPDGQTHTAPMAKRMSLLTGPDRAVRKAAFEGANATWQAHEQTTAAALNAIGGTRHTLFRRRGVGHFLDEAARASRITRPTLEALLGAMETARPFAREVLRYRQELLGAEEGCFYDLHAPVAHGDAGELEWGDAAQLVSTSFHAAYPALGEFMDEMLEKRWIDYSPRDNKRPGGFCTSSALIRESRIFMTFEGTMNEVMTLAHEAGHAWHNRVLRPRRALAASYPMTLAESASTFAEMILSSGVLADDRFSAAQKLQIVDADTDRVLAFLLDIPMRFRFEEAFYTERAKGVLSPARLRELMVQAQRDSFGETLAEGQEDPWFWSSKLHFYIDGTFFYNYPYSFGYLLSLSLFARFREEGASFLPAYERLLADTGSMNCEEVVQKNLGEDIGDPAFWTRAIATLEPSFASLKRLTRA